MKKISLWILLGVMCTLINHTAYSRDFVIIATPQEPYKFKEENTLKGIDIEVIDIVMKRLGIPYKITFIKSDARIQVEARKGRADMLLLFSKKKNPARISNLSRRILCEHYMELFYSF